MTNADKIRSMTDEELTDMLHKVTYACWDQICRADCPLAYGCGSDRHWMEDWLREEARDG